MEENVILELMLRQVGAAQPEGIELILNPVDVAFAGDDISVEEV